MLESMEGKKGQPRKRPPFPAERGLWSRPTTVDNAETVSHVPLIIMRGADWFKKEGAPTPNSTGHTLFGISGHVKRPGIYEMPLGVKMRDLIYKVRRRPARRDAPGQGGHPGWRLDADPARRSNRRRGRSRIAQDRQLAARHCRRDHHGRSHLHGARCAGRRAFLRA